MPTGLRRLQGGGQPHFITFSCFHRQPYLKDRAARDIFEQKFEAVRDKYGFFISAYVVMPNHVHLLISECPAALPGTCMQSLKIRVSKALPESPFWNKRYFDVNVISEQQWVNAVSYIHRNPVKRGLVQRPEDWAWSSAKSYATLTSGVVRIESFYQARRDPKLNLDKALGLLPPEPPANGDTKDKS